MTTQDSLFRRHADLGVRGGADKEVHGYARALRLGADRMKDAGGISWNVIKDIQRGIDPGRPGFRTSPGTELVNEQTGQVVYRPPSPAKIPGLMEDLERYINDDSTPEDPLVKMAVIHHWFETIHPFYDGNGRTGRIVNILYLVMRGLLDAPVLYLSRHINRNRGDYYRLLQAVRDEGRWEDWVLYMLEGVSETSKETTVLVGRIDGLLKEQKNAIRGRHRFYSHDLINNLFEFPYTKAKILQEALGVSRATAARHLDALAKDGIVERRGSGRGRYFVNTRLCGLLAEF